MHSFWNVAPFWVQEKYACEKARIHCVHTKTFVFNLCLFMFDISIKAEVKLNVRKMKLVGGFNGCCSVVLGDSSTFFKWKICKLHKHQYHDDTIISIVRVIIVIGSSSKRSSLHHDNIMITHNIIY